MPRPVVCLTPVKNEAWILEQFLLAAGVWADHIIIADQGSDDDSRSIAARHPKVWLIENSSKAFNEPERQLMLIEAARSRWPGAILIALDADEMLSPRLTDSPEWKRALQQPAGTNVRMRWANVQPGMKRIWNTPHYRNFGFIDDGTPHQGQPIHSPRVPLGLRPPIDLIDYPVYHFQFIDWERMESKHRWYQCHERVMDPGRSAVRIYRQYHHMDAIPASWDSPFPPIDAHAFSSHGIDLGSIRTGGPYRWDREVLRLFQWHGEAFFRQADVWRTDWATIAASYPELRYAFPGNPQRRIDRVIFAWLRKTQRYRRWPFVWLLDRVAERLWPA